MSLNTQSSSVAQISRRLLIAESTTRRLIQNGDLKAHRVGRQLRIFEKDLSDYLARTANTNQHQVGGGGHAA